jgi:hypothetical protein
MATLAQLFSGLRIFSCFNQAKVLAQAFFQELPNAGFIIDNQHRVVGEIVYVCFVITFYSPNLIHLISGEYYSAEAPFSLFVSIIFLIMGHFDRQLLNLFAASL